MLRSMLMTLQNQKSKIVLLCFVVLAILLFSKLMMKSIWTYKNIIATTSATKSANTLLQTIVESYNSSHTLSKLKMDEVGTFDESSSLDGGEKDDFAVIAPGASIPNGFEVIASLNEEKVILVSHKENHVEQLKDIRNSTINIVSINEYDEKIL